MHPPAHTHTHMHVRLHACVLRDNTTAVDKLLHCLSLKDLNNSELSLRPKDSARSIGPWITESRKEQSVLSYHFSKRNSTLKQRVYIRR